MPLPASTLALALLGLGLRYRRQRPVHWRLMLAAFVVDLGVVVQLQPSREVLQPAARSTHPLVRVHGGISLAVPLCWLVLLRLGWRLLHREGQVRRAHRAAAAAFLVLRLANFTTSLVLPAAPPPAMAQR